MQYIYIYTLDILYISVYIMCIYIYIEIAYVFVCVLFIYVCIHTVGMYKYTFICTYTSV